MIPFYKSPLTYIVIGLFLSVAVIAQAQFWTPPPADFPAGNVYVPVTTGSSTQYKQGTLRLDYLQLSTSTGVGQNAITFPYNRGIAGFDASGRAQSIIYPYAGALWGLFLSNRNTAGSGGVITLLSTQTGSQSRLQLYPDGRITTIGTFVLPNTATTSLPATARVPGAMVYTNGAPYFYKNATEGWLPIGSGAGGGGGSWVLDPTSQGILYSDATNPNVKISTTLKNVTLSVDGTLNVNKVPATWPTGWYYDAGNAVNAGANAGTTVTIDDFKVAYPGEFDSYATLSDIPRINSTGANTDAAITCQDLNPSNAGVVNGSATTAECDGAPYGAVRGAISRPTLYDLRVWVDAGSYIVGYKKFTLKQDTVGAVGGVVNAAQYCLSGSCIVDWPAGGGGGDGIWSTSTTGGIIYYNGGNVGIGTTTPGLPLHVRNNAPDPGIIRLESDTQSSDIGMYRDAIRISRGDNGYFFNNGQVVIGNNPPAALKSILLRGSNVTIDREIRVNGSGPSYFSAGSVGIGTTTPQARLAINSGSDEMIQLNRDGAANPVQFRLGTNGILVVANATDTLFIKNGKVAIGGNIGIDEKIRLEVAKGDLKVSADFSGPSGYLYEKQSGATGSGYLDGWVSNSIFPRCIDSTSQCDTDMSYENGESDCGDKFYAKERLSVSGDICYNWTLAKTSGSSGTAVPVSLIYKLQSNTPVFTGGGAQFDNSISIGGNTSVSGFAPAVTLSPGGGSGNYTIRNTGGNLGFVNASNDKRITLRQDGMLNLNVRQDTDYGYGLLVTADGASINRTKALAVNTTLDASDRFVVYGNGDVRTKGSLTLGENLGSVARNTVISSKIYTLPVDFASAPTWKNIDGTNQRGMYFIAVNGMTNNLGSVDDNGYPVGLWVCSASTFSGNRTCTEITKKNGYGTSPSTGSCDGQIVNLIWPDTGPIQISTTQPGNACTSDPGRTVPVNMRFNVSVVSF